MDHSLLMLAAVVGCAFVCSCLLTAGMLRWAPRLGLVDQPSARKFHARTTPKGGGVAIYFGFAATVALLAPDRLSDSRTAVFLGVGFLIVLLGLLDDLFQLPWHLRIAMQAAAALAVFGWPPETGWLPPILALIWVVGLINAFNMLDNMDALSAGVAAIAALFSGLLVCLPPALDGFGFSSTSARALPYVALLGASLGFLCFNRPPARIFMGDAGSTFLGFFFGVRSLQDGLAEPAAPATWIVPLCLLAVPWYDMTAVVLLRLSQGRSPFHADKQHLSHRLVDRGLSAPWAVGTIHLLALASGAAAVVLTVVPREQAIIVIAIVALGWIGVATADFVARRRPAGKTQTGVEATEGR